MDSKFLNLDVVVVIGSYSDLNRTGKCDVMILCRKLTNKVL
jgi:hypothetical protein